MEHPQSVLPSEPSIPLPDPGAAAASPVAPAPARPTSLWALLWWTVVVILGGQIFGLQLVRLVGAIFRGVLPPMTADPHHRLTAEGYPWMFGFTCAISLFMTVSAVRRAPEGWRVRLGWRRPRLAWRDLGVATLATVALDVVTMTLMSGMQLLHWLPSGEQDLPGYSRAILDGPLGAVWAILVMASIAAPVMEESLYRGYLQRGVTALGRPVLALWLTALLFSLSHGRPLTIVGALPFALWQCWIAWRCDSVVPCMVNHAVVNALWLSVGIAGRLNDWPMLEEAAKGWMFGYAYPQWAPVLGVGSLVVFALCAGWVVRAVRASDARQPH